MNLGGVRRAGRHSMGRIPAKACAGGCRLCIGTRKGSHGVVCTVPSHTSCGAQACGAATEGCTRNMEKEIERRNGNFATLDQINSREEERSRFIDGCPSMTPSILLLSVDSNEDHHVAE